MISDPACLSRGGLHISNNSACNVYTLSNQVLPLSLPLSLNKGHHILGHVNAVYFYKAYKCSVRCVVTLNIRNTFLPSRLWFQHSLVPIYLLKLSYILNVYHKITNLTALSSCWLLLQYSFITYIAVSIYQYYALCQPVANI